MLNCNMMFWQSWYCKSLIFIKIVCNTFRILPKGYKGRKIAKHFTYRNKKFYSSEAIRGVFLYIVGAIVCWDYEYIFIFIIRLLFQNTLLPFLISCVMVAAYRVIFSCVHLFFHFYYVFFVVVVVFCCCCCCCCCCRHHRRFSFKQWIFRICWKRLHIA